MEWRVEAHDANFMNSPFSTACPMEAPAPALLTQVLTATTRRTRRFAREEFSLNTQWSPLHHGLPARAVMSPLHHGLPAKAVISTLNSLVRLLYGCSILWLLLLSLFNFLSMTVIAFGHKNSC